MSIENRNKKRPHNSSQGKCTFAHRLVTNCGNKTLIYQMKIARIQHKIHHLSMQNRHNSAQITCKPSIFSTQSTISQTAHLITRHSEDLHWYTKTPIFQSSPRQLSIKTDQNPPNQRFSSLKVHDICIQIRHIFRKLLEQSGHFNRNSQ